MERFHPDNAPAHSALLIRQFRAKNQMIFHRPTFFPDLASYYFLSFSKLKLAIKERRFDNISDIKTNSSWDWKRNFAGMLCEV